MSYLLQRPAPGFNSREGLLRAEHFQMAYVTSDADRACDLFGRQLGIRSFARLEGPTSQGGRIRAEFAWVGTLMYEIIEASGPGAEIFTGRMPAKEGFRLFHHHLGFLVPDPGELADVLSNARAHGWGVPHTGENSLTKVAFVDVPELPHYLEYLSPTPAGIDFFNSIPRS
jgi:hypothetical protein